MWNNYYRVISGTEYLVTAATPERALEVLAISEGWEDGEISQYHVETVRELDAVTEVTGSLDDVTVTMPAGLWAHILDALDAYKNDEDARYDYPETAAALDAAYPIIQAAYGKAGN